MAESPLDLPPASGLLGSSPSLLSSISAEMPDVDTAKCRLMGSFALGIQALMGFIVLGSLLVKRQRERPRRKYRIWTADISKQVIGQAFVHVLNVSISSSIASRPSGGNACALYFINILVDTTVGVFILWLSLRLCTHFLSVTLDLPLPSLGLISGIYPPPFFKSWLRQLGVYLAALTMMKGCVIFMFFMGGEQMVRFGDRILESFSPDAKVQVVISLMIGPTLLNVLQYLLIDSFIKNRSQDHSNPDFLETEDEEALLDEHSSEEEDPLFHERRLDQSPQSSRRSFHQSRPPYSNPRGRGSNRKLSNGAGPARTQDLPSPHSYPPQASHTNHTSHPGAHHDDGGWDDDSWADWNDESDEVMERQLAKPGCVKDKHRPSDVKVITVFNPGRTRAEKDDGPVSAKTPMTPTIVISEVF